MIDMKGFKSFLIEEELSENTRESYIWTMQKFSEQYSEFNKENAILFKADYVKSFSPKTVNNRISALEKYAKFVDCPLHLKRVKVHKISSVENVIKPNQYKTLVDYLKESKNYRMLIIIMLMAKTGGRISEVLRYKKRDIKNGYVDMKTKGKTRRIYFPKSLRDDISEYIADLNDNDFLCKNRFGESITSRGVDANLKTLGEKLSIPIDVMHAHSFRHFFAIEFLKRNNNISLLADLMGHSGVNTTMIYLRMSQEEQKSAIDEAVNW